MLNRGYRESRDRRLRPGALHWLETLRRLSLVGWLALLAGSFQTPHLIAQEAPARGKLLIASRGLLDPNFYRTVVLLIEADERGALGLIVNRRTEVPAVEVLQDADFLRARSDRLWQGGPVEPERIYVLARDERGREGVEAPAPGVVVLVDADQVRREIEDQDPGAEDVRILSGYAGWGPGQLESEIDSGGWHLWTAGPEWIFFEDSKQMWEVLLELATTPTA